MRGKSRRSSSKRQTQNSVNKFSRSFGFQRLPNELLHSIARFCDPETFLEFGKTCKSLLSLLNNEKCWDTIFVRELQRHGIIITSWNLKTYHKLSEFVKHSIIYLNQIKHAESSFMWTYRKNPHLWGNPYWVYPTYRKNPHLWGNPYWVYNHQPSLHKNLFDKPQMSKSEISQQRLTKLPKEFSRKQSFNQKDLNRQFRSRPPNKGKFSHH